MLESIAARIVNNLLGKYVEELDTEGLNVGIFSGQVNLQNLKLKPSCLYELELPIEVGNGIIGELRLIIPWSCFRAKPIHITLQDLLIVAHPLGLLPYNEDRDRELRRSAARRVLSRIANEPSSFIQSFLNTVLPMFGHTIQLHVHNVHIRYEDPSAGIAIGLLVQEFSVETTNSKWKPVNQNSGGSVYQLLRLEALSLYINTGLPKSHMVVSDDSWIEHMRKALEQFQLKRSPLNLVIKPVNAKLKIIVADDAPLLVDIVVQDVVLSLTDKQLSALRETSQYLHRIKFYRKFLAKRPNEQIKGNASHWWKYAMIAVLEERVLPYTWSRFSLLRKSYREYKSLYKQCVLNPGDTELKLDLQRTEDNLPLFCVVIAREHAKSEVFEAGVENVILADKQGRYCLKVRSLSKEDEEPIQFIEFKLNVTVDNVSMSLLRDGREVLCAALGGCVSSFEVRKDEARRASARIASILIEGTTCDAELVTLLSSSTPASSQSAHGAISCFSMDIEQKPLSCMDTAKYGLSVAVTPMEIIYQEHAFSEILHWLTDVEWNRFLKMDQTPIIHSNFLLSLDLHASIALPRIIIPESGSLQKSGLVLIVDPGKWCLETELQSLLTVEELAEMTQMELEERLYHRFQLQWSDVQLLLTDSGEEWRDLAVRDESIGHILSRMSGSLTISVSTKQEYRLLPRLKLNLAVPFVHACVSERRIEQFYQLLNNVPVPRMVRRNIMFLTAPVLWPTDRILPEPDVPYFINLTQKIIITQLKRQRNGESVINTVPLKSTNLDGSVVSMEKIGSETSDEDLELWARAVDHPGFEDNVSPHNAITILLRITVKELVLNLPKCVEFQERAYLMIRVGYISVDVALMEYGPAVQLAVRAFQLIDKQHISANGEYLEMVSTHGDQDFFSLLYRKVLADCPDFKSHFHGVEESLVIDFGSMSLVLRRDAYQNMFYFLRRLTNMVTDKTLLQRVKKLWEDLKIWVPLLESRDVPVPTGGIKFSYSVQFNKLQARLREADLDMLDITISGFGGDWYLRANDRLILRIHLQGLAIDDLSDTTLYSQIVSQDEDEVFEIKFIRMNAGAMTKRNVTQGKLKITLGRLHILFAHHIVQIFQRFSSLFVNEATKTAQGFLKNWAANGWLDEYRNCQRAWQLSLNLHLPVILLPPGPTAATLFIVNTGDLKVENFIKDDSSGHVVDNILIRVENTFITRGMIKLNGDVESREEFLEHVKLKIDIKRSLMGVTGIDVVSSIDNVRVCMGQKDFGLVLNLLATNHSITQIFDFWEPRTTGDPFELRNLQIFLRDGNKRRRDSSFRFSLDSFILMLYFDMDEQLSSPVRDMSHALCKLQFDDLLTNVETQATGLSEFRLSIKNIILDDVRTDAAVLVPRIFGPRIREDIVADSAFCLSSPPLVDVVGKENERGDRCFDILVEKTRLGLSISFIAALVKFIEDGIPMRRDEFEGCDNLGYVADSAPKGKKENIRCVDHASDEIHKGLSLSVQLKRPELALIGCPSVDIKDLVGFVWRCEVFLDWSCSPGREELVLRFSDLRLTTIQQSPMVMRPCDLQMVRNATTTGGARMTVDASPLYFTFSSGTFIAVNTILDEFEMAFPKRRESTAVTFAQLFEFEDLWSQKKITDCCDAILNYSNNDGGHCAPNSFPVATPAESIAINIAKITAIVGIQMANNQCQPFFVGKASIKLQAQDWNSSIGLNGEAQMEVTCWNEDLETWEPVLQPLTISCRMYQSCALPISPAAVRSSRSASSRNTPPVTAQRTTDSQTDTDSDSDDNDVTMTFIKPEQFNLGPDSARPTDVLPSGPDMEIDDGVLGRLHAGIVHLFVKNDESSDDGEDETSDDVETESATSGTRSPRFSPTERAVFLNKHADSVDSGLETEAVDRQAVHVLIHAVSPLRIILTPNVLKSIQALINPPTNFLPHGKRIVNYLGPGSSVQLIQQGCVVAVGKFEHGSGASTPEMTPPASPTHSISQGSYVVSDNDRISPDAVNEDLNEFVKKISNLRLNIEIPGFDAVTLSVGKMIAKKEIKLQPVRSGVQYSAIVSTIRNGDFTHYAVASPFQVYNKTTYPIGLYYKKSTLDNIGETVIGECANPFDEATRLAVVAPDDTYHVPLTVCHHSQIHFLPLHLTNHALSLEGISWSTVKSNPEAIHDYVYPDTDALFFSFKVGWKNDGIVNISPPLLLRNVLPCACEMKLPNGQIIRLEAGEESNVYAIDLRTQLQLTMSVPEYMGLAWHADFQIGPDSKEKLVVMAADQDTDGGNKQLAVNIFITRSQTDTLLLYTPYWLLNRTGLGLLIRGSGSHVIQEWTDGQPLLFTYRKPRSRAVRLRVLTSSWSPAFSLDAVGCNGLIVCRDRERNKKFRVIMECVPCTVEPTLCRAITFLPYITVENGYRKNLRFMEDNEKADLWFDIGPGQIIPFWPDTETMQMVVRLRDSKNSSVPFPVTSPHVTALRIDKGYALTVEVTGGDLKPLRVLLRPYRTGDAPVRIDNLCVDLFLRLRQKDCPQVALLSPSHSLLYTWDDPCKERNLLWSIYNNAGQELSAHWQNDAYGEERITFRSVRANVDQVTSPESSDTSDDDPSLTNDPSVSKRIRKDTIVVYWSCFLQGGQRVLLITEDERLARKARRVVESERSSIELFCAIYSCSISLLNYDANKILREVAHLTINSSPSQWELNVGDRCKMLTPDVASWLETNFVNDVPQPKINDLIQVDLTKMQMTRPLFGSLRRRQRAACWIQYRSSIHLSVLQMHIYRVQLDDQRINTTVPCVFYISPSATNHPAVEGTLLWRQSPNGDYSVKFTSMSVQDHVLHVDSDWLTEICGIARNLWPSRDSLSKMREDILRLHTQSASHVLQVLEEASQPFVEQLHFGSISLNLTVWPSSIVVGKNFALPVPDVFAGLLSAIQAMPGPISNIPVKLRDYEQKRERFSIERVIAHYRTQLLQQLHVLIFGLSVLATPSAKIEQDGLSRKDIVIFPEEFSKALSLEAETKMAARLIAEPAPCVPDSVWVASRSFPLGCVLAVSGLGIRSNMSMGWESFGRGAGRAVIALLNALQTEPKSFLPNPLFMLLDQINRFGTNVLCRVRAPLIVNPILGVRPFSIIESQGASLLYSLNRGRFNCDTYWGHSPLTIDFSSCLLITLERLILAEQVGKSNSFDISWTCCLNTLQNVISGIDNSILISAQTGSEVTERKIVCCDAQVLNYLLERINEAIHLTSI